MKTIIIDKTFHRGEEVVLIQFPFDDNLGKEVRKINNIKWSQTLKGWWTPYSIDVLSAIKTIFNPISIIDAQPLKDKVEKEKLHHSSFSQTKNQETVTINYRIPIPTPIEIPKQVQYNSERIVPAPTNKKVLSPETIRQIDKFIYWLQSRRYSDNTVKTYSEALKVFLLYYHDKSILEITNDDIINFNNRHILANKLSASYQNQVVNAIKLFFRTMQNMKIDVTLIHRPKTPKLLPNVLSKEEVKQIFDATKNLKHRAMLSLIYACGLRCGEILRLLPLHVDTQRMVLIIKQGKGRKDRIAPLSSKIVTLLQTYFKAYKPQVYLFEGVTEGEPYDARSLQNVLKQNVARTKINKPVSLHWLRHSYATHLLENGTDLRYIQEILGHSSSKTTEIYTHVSNKSIQKIVSPFDTL